MDPLDLVRKALEAWGVELVLNETLDRYSIVVKDGRTLRTCVSASAYQEMKAEHPNDAAVQLWKVTLGSVLEELCVEPTPATT